MDRRFQSDDGRFGLSLPSAQEQALERLAAEAWPDETGGVLIGFYDAPLDLATVTQVVPPPPDSRGGPTWFHRGVSGLSALFTRIWHRDRDRREHYLGEWHVHPGGLPLPSRRDTEQMLRIARDPGAACATPLLLIVAGSADDWKLAVHVAQRDGSLVQLRPFD